MDTAFTSKSSAPVATTFVRPDVQPVREAVQTDLAAPKAVTAVSNAAAYANESAAKPAPFSREITIDPQSREVIFRVVDVRSRQVVRQVPDQALLRMRAYTRALDDGKTQAEAQNLADKSV